MGQEYGDWFDWILCLCITISFTVGALVYKPFEKLRTLVVSLSPLRRVFGVLSLVAIPYMVSAGFGEQAASPMNPQGSILWFTAGAVNAVVFFWACEELITTKPSLRGVFLGTVGTLVILALHHQVNWVVMVSQEIANDKERQEAREGLHEANDKRLYAQLLHPCPVQSKSKEHSDTPPSSQEQSFVLVSPGVVVNGDSWDFLVIHKGSQKIESIDIDFIDLDKLEHLKATTASGVAVMPQEYSVFVHLDQMFPKGLGSLFAKQFLWKPFSFEHGHYTSNISASTGRFHEELYIEHVDNDWKYAAVVTEIDTHKTLFMCRQPGFPRSVAEKIVTSNKCWPEMMQ